MTASRKTALLMNENKPSHHHRRWKKGLCASRFDARFIISMPAEAVNWPRHMSPMPTQTQPETAIARERGAAAAPI